MSLPIQQYDWMTYSWRGSHVSEFEIVKYGYEFGGFYIALFVMTLTYVVLIRFKSTFAKVIAILLNTLLFLSIPVFAFGLIWSFNLMRSGPTNESILYGYKYFSFAIIAFNIASILYLRRSK